MATIKSPEIISQAWDYVSERLGETSSIVKPVLDRFVFIDGSAGVGKTQVIARNAIKFIGSKNIWLSAPKDTQI
jgi:flagellar biosynthesis GTPase FlhF